MSLKKLAMIGWVGLWAVVVLMGMNGDVYAAAGHCDGSSSERDAPGLEQGVRCGVVETAAGSPAGVAEPFSGTVAARQSDVPRDDMDPIHNRKPPNESANSEQPVPRPEALALFGIGLTALALWRRRR